MSEDKNKQQLREELMSEPDNEAKFQAYMDKVRKDKGAFPQRYSPEQVEEVAKKFQD